jgi:hypothetical protein
MAGKNSNNKRSGESGNTAGGSSSPVKTPTEGTAELLPGLAGADAAAPPASEKRRANPVADDAKLAELGLRQSAATGPGMFRHGNQRRTPDTLKLVLIVIGVVAALFAGFTAMLFSYYQRTLVPELQSMKAGIAQRVVPSELESSTAIASTRTELAVAQNELTKAHNQIANLQRQVTSLQDKQEAADDRLSKFAEHVQSTLTSGKPAENTAGLSVTQVASVVPVATPANQELWTLKERNRLTLYADQAIAQGSSEAMQNLWHSLEEPELAKLREGVQAEIIRVQNYYSHLSRLPPEYRLPVRDLFAGDTSIRSEADLKTPQLISLLLDLKQPVEVRARSAFVLGGRRSEDTARALINCMKLDPVLDVVKEAQRTLSDDYGMKVPPLHLRAAEEWWTARTTDKH